MVDFDYETQVEAVPGLEQKLSFSDRYKALEKIGKGGQGKVYKVEEVETGKIYAVKRVPLDRWEEVDQLEAEVRALRLLNHPNIVAYLESSSEEDEWKDPEFRLIMEYIDGKSASQLLSERKLSEEELLKIRDQIIAGLQYAHQQGIVHRDIKPKNIMLTKEGQVKITDFGLAKFLEEETRLSSVGKGTISYMAPEQIFGGKITPETDYHGLGLTLIALASGKERADDIRHQKPKEDIERLRSQGKYSSAFLDSLERLVDEDPEKRKEGLSLHDLMENRQIDLKENYFESFTYGLGIATLPAITLGVMYGVNVESPAFAIFVGLVFQTVGGLVGYSVGRIRNNIRRRKARKQQEQKLTRVVQEAYAGALDSSQLNPGRKALPLEEDKDNLMNQCQGHLFQVLMEIIHY